MWVWVDSTGPVLFDAALSTALFLTLVVLAVLLCRQPTRRLLIARVAIVASLAMIPLVALAPLPRLDLLATLLQSELVPSSLVVVLSDADSRSAESNIPEHKGDLVFGSELIDRLTGSPDWLPRSLTVIDVACMSMGLAWLLLGFWGVRWLIRNSRPPLPATKAIFDRLFDETSHRRNGLALRVSSRVQRPVVVGLFRPTILLPSAFDEPGGDPELLRLSLLHEIAHADGHDPWFGAIASLAQTVWFFLPQIWWLRSQLMIDQEFLADRSAALRYGTSSGYAASLLSLAASRPGMDAESRRLETVAQATAGRGSSVDSPLSQRVLMLLYCPFRFEASAPRSWSWTLRIALAMAMLFAACLCIRWPHASAIEQRLKTGTTNTRLPFRVTDFTSEPLVFSKGGRALSYVMPVALPSRFDLTVEVLSTSSRLGKVRIAGHPLVATAFTADGAESPRAPTDAMEIWHQVRLKRTSSDVSLWVDDQPSPAHPRPEATTEWLTFEPDPERPTQFRNLVVEW